MASAQLVTPRPAPAEPPPGSDGECGRAAAIIDVRNLNFYYGAKRALESHHDRHPAQPRHRVHRAVGLRQEHVPAHAQPDERHHPGHPRRGHGRSSTATTSTRRGHRRRRAAPPGRDGVPEVEPVPEVDLRERRLRPAHQRPGPRSSRARTRGSRRACRPAAIWDEVKDRLHESALALSGGQQQRLCIARALAIKPEILLMDEPASALDPIATQRIEELIYQLKARYTIVIVTHNMQQAARVSDQTAFFWLGRLVEVRPDRPDLHEPGREADGRLRHREGSDRPVGRDHDRSSAFPGGARTAQDAAARDGRARRGPGPRRGRRRWSSATPALVDARARAATGRSTSCTSKSTTAASSCWRCTSRWPSTCGRSSRR